VYSKAVHIATFETWIRALLRFKTGKASTYHPPTAGRVAVTAELHVLNGNRVRKFACYIYLSIYMWEGYDDRLPSLFCTQVAAVCAWPIH